MNLADGNLLVVGVGTSWLPPLISVAAGAATAVVVCVGLWLLLQWLAPKVAAIAQTTAKEAVSQPLFYLILALGITALLIFPFVPYNTFGEDVKMLKAEDLTLIKVLAIVLALWTASLSIADEIEGRTALTVLSKPIGRRQFILGKFIGILVPVVMVFLVLGGLFLASVSYKVAYDARESALPEPTSLECMNEMVQIAPGLALAFLEAVVMTAISVAISTRLPMLPNLTICVSVYALGHLVPVLVNSSIGQFEVVNFVGRFLAAVLPVLEHFSMETAISTGQRVPWAYLAAATGYAALYSLMALFLALLLFEDRDLA
jgi:hypothetical protein